MAAEAATHVRAWSVVGSGRDLKFGHWQLVRREVVFGNRVCGYRNVHSGRYQSSLQTTMQHRLGGKQA